LIEMSLQPGERLEDGGCLIFEDEQTSIIGSMDSSLSSIQVQ